MPRKEKHSASPSPSRTQLGLAAAAAMVTGAGIGAAAMHTVSSKQVKGALRAKASQDEQIEELRNEYERENKATLGREKQLQRELNQRQSENKAMLDREKKLQRQLNRKQKELSEFEAKLKQEAAVYEAEQAVIERIKPNSSSVDEGIALATRTGNNSVVQMAFDTVRQYDICESLQAQSKQDEEETRQQQTKVEKHKAILDADATQVADRIKRGEATDAKLRQRITQLQNEAAEQVAALRQQIKAEQAAHQTTAEEYAAAAAAAEELIKVKDAEWKRKYVNAATFAKNQHNKAEQAEKAREQAEKAREEAREQAEEAREEARELRDQAEQAEKAREEARELRDQMKSERDGTQLRRVGQPLQGPGLRHMPSTPATTTTKKVGGGTSTVKAAAAAAAAAQAGGEYVQDGMQQIGRFFGRGMRQRNGNGGFSSGGAGALDEAAAMVVESAPTSSRASPRPAASPDNKTVRFRSGMGSMPSTGYVTWGER